jgi:hypothetical protein
VRDYYVTLVALRNALTVCGQTGDEAAEGGGGVDYPLVSI